jgi:hypothetical protein
MVIWTCECCNFNTPRKFIYDGHLKSKKHGLHKNIANNPLQTFDCNKCNQTYFSKSGLYFHNKKCTAIPQNIIPPPKTIITTDAIQQVIESDKELFNEIQELQKSQEKVMVIMYDTNLNYNYRAFTKKELKKRKIPVKKQTIPLTLKRNVWDKHIGENIGKNLCLCCNLTDITQMNFSCGHIISEHNGGELKLDNLKPICVSCNSSMGTKNMDEFMLEYGL